jgi:hypothetical protein
MSIQLKHRLEVGTNVAARPHTAVHKVADLHRQHTSVFSLNFRLIFYQVGAAKTCYARSPHASSRHFHMPAMPTTVNVIQQNFLDDQQHVQSRPTT